MTVEFEIGYGYKCKMQNRKLKLNFKLNPRTGLNKIELTIHDAK